VKAESNRRRSSSPERCRHGRGGHLERAQNAALETVGLIDGPALVSVVMERAAAERRVAPSAGRRRLSRQKPCVSPSLFCRSCVVVGFRDLRARLTRSLVVQPAQTLGRPAVTPCRRIGGVMAATKGLRMSTIRSASAIVVVHAARSRCGSTPSAAGAVPAPASSNSGMIGPTGGRTWPGLLVATISMASMRPRPLYVPTQASAMNSARCDRRCAAHPGGVLGNLVVHVDVDRRDGRGAAAESR